MNRVMGMIRILLVGIGCIVLVAMWCIIQTQKAQILEPPYTKTIKVTAYCPCDKCCGKWADDITASGAKAQGKLIAAPKEIPFGTWIDIPSYGMAEVLDRGGAIKGRRLDLLFPTHQEALNWGVKYLEISINLRNRKGTK